MRWVGVEPETSVVRNKGPAAWADSLSRTPRGLQRQKCKENHLLVQKPYKGL